MLVKNQPLVGIAVALASIILTPAIAAADESDPPTRVARLAYAEGAVSFQPGGTQDWVAAIINRPLTTGDQLWADSNSRAELQLDGSLLRLAGGTAMSLLNLGDDVTQIQLSSGSLLIRVRRLDDNETYEIDTPNLAFSILRPGLYRLTVDPTGASTTIRVRSGQGEVTGGGAAYTVRAEEDDVFTGTDQLAEYAQNAPAEDDFDAWSANRDGRWEHSESARYVSPDVVGYEDLDDQGTWRATPEYGNVWFPTRIEAGWAPYHTGHWSYIAPWGYTWVDDQPWGFAPFHYGRWVSFHDAWGWIPAPPRPAFGVYVRPVYAPALVAWVGVGAGVAWFALGPREVYVPSYPVSRRYVNNINVSNTNVNTTVINNVYNTTIVNNKTVNVTNVNYVNRNVGGAIAATSTQAFSTAQPVSRNPMRVDQRALASAPVHSFAPATVPTKQAVLGSAQSVSVKPPAGVEARTVVARTAPPPPQPTFEKREQAIRANEGRPLSPTQVRQIQTSEPARAAPVRIAPAATPIAAAPVQARGLTPKPAGPSGASSQSRPMPPPAPSPAPNSNVGARPPSIAVHPSELPPVPKPASPAAANSALEREHLQQQQQLQAQQEQERQRIQQQQELAHQQLEKQQADAARNQQIEQEHQRQTQQLAQQHALEMQQLLQKQQAERQLQEKQAKPASQKNDKPATH